MNYLATVTGTDQQSGNKLRVVATLKYDPAHRLVGLHLEGDVTDVFYKWFFTNAPILKEIEMKQFMYNAKNVKLDIVPEDLSFDRFWSMYDHKISDKKRTLKKWTSMDDTSRAKAISYISTYNRHLFENPGISKCYAETYLNREMWNN